MFSTLSQEERETLSRLGAMAMTYVWGRQDAGEDNHDRGASIRFRDAYWEHARRYYEGGKSGELLDIRSAFEQWQQGARIGS